MRVSPSLLRKKLILNVSKIRLRLIFPRASDLPRLFQKAYGRAFFKTDRDVRGSMLQRRFVLCTNLVGRTPKDGRGISQKQVLEQNLSSTDVHGRTSVERYMDVQLFNAPYQAKLKTLKTGYTRPRCRTLFCNHSSFYTTKVLFY